MINITSSVLSGNTKQNSGGKKQKLTNVLQKQRLVGIHQSNQEVVNRGSSLKQPTSQATSAQRGSEYVPINQDSQLVGDANNTPDLTLSGK